MRYSNWDVLLFPDRSRVPIQEFRTQCCTIPDKDSPYLHTSYFNAQISYQRSLGQLPVVACFIPSLPAQSPFRVSVHSWEKPEPSRILESFMHPDDYILYEARLYVDNVYVAGSLFGPNTSWPTILDYNSQVDKNGTQDVLRFPQFHPEVIDSYVWNASESHGRLRVIISEGFSRHNRLPPFERVKDLVMFSFQHAPLNVLENCGIAWPNSNMWNQLPMNLFRNQLNHGGYRDYDGLRENKNSKNDNQNDGLHTHSPTRYDTTRCEQSQVNGYECGYNNAYSSVPQWTTQKPLVQSPAAAQDPAGPSLINWPNFIMESRPNLQPTNYANNGFMGSADPFIDPILSQRLLQVQRSSMDDISMPDAGPMSVSSRAMSSSLNGMSYEHSHQASVAASQEDNSLDFVGPMNSSSSSKVQTTATASTTVSAQQTAIPSMPPVSRPSAAAQARSESYSKSKRNSISQTAEAAAVIAREARQVSNSSTKSDQIDNIVSAVSSNKDIRQVSGSSTRSGQTDVSKTNASKPTSDGAEAASSSSIAIMTTSRKVNVSPDGKIKGKKENLKSAAISS